jgi:hypothetical protein
MVMEAGERGRVVARNSQEEIQNSTRDHPSEK